MSSKKSKDKFDQIIIETTQLKIDIKTTGDLTTKEYDLLPFHPNMSDLRDLSNNSYVLFPSFVKITMKDLEKAGVGEDYPKVFLNLEKYIKLIKYVTSQDRVQDYTLFIDRAQVKNYATAMMQNSLTDILSDEASDIISIQKYEPLTEEEIITNNIELIKRLFLPIKSHFYILGNDYVIGKSKYIPPFVASSETNTKLDTPTRKVPLAYTVKFELELLDAANNPEAGDFMKMSCKGKKNVIAKDAMDIFGTNFGYIPEKKAPIQSILNTSEATKKRQFGKLQKEWEERNKYVKAPANERERLEQESKWTPLQKKMAQYDKYQEVYNKIPPMWIKERKDLKSKYEDFKKNIGKLWQDIKNIEGSNTADDSVRRDMIDPVIDNMKASIIGLSIIKESVTDEVKKKYADTLQVSGIANQLKELLDYHKKYKEIDNQIKNEKDDKLKEQYVNEKISLPEKIYNLKDINDLLKNIADISKTDFYKASYEADKKIIDDKYIKPLLDEANVDSKKKDLEVLIKRETELRLRIKPNDPYGNKSAQVDLAKAQGELRKKEAEIKMLEEKFGKDASGKIDGSKLIKTWEESQGQLEKLGETIKQDKTIEEKKIKVESVNKELDEKLKEIVKLKKDLMLAKFFAGQYDDLDKEKFESKAAKERPLESVDTLQANLDLAKDQYLEIAGKFSDFNKLQAKITLLSSDLTDLKELKDAKNKGKKKMEGEIKTKSDAKLNIARIVKESQRTEKTANEIKEEEGYNKDIDLLQKEIADKYTAILDKTELKIKLYNAYIDFLKDKGQNEPNITTLLKEKETKFSDKDTGLLKQLDDLIKKRQAEKENPVNDTKALTKEIEVLQNEIKELEKASPKDKDIIDAKKLEMENKKKEQTFKNNNLDKILQSLNKDYEDNLIAFREKKQGGGKLLRRTRKYRHQKKPSKRYILSKHKIKKSKSSRYRKKKYTLRRLR